MGLAPSRSLTTSCQVRIQSGYALATPPSTTPINSSLSSRKVASCAEMNCGSRMAGIPSLGGPPPRISSGGMLCLVKSKPLRHRATANRPTNLNPVFIGPPDLSSLEYANTVGAKLEHLFLEKEKTKSIVRPNPDLLSPHVRERLLPC